jgi:hypothetical protein
MIFKWKNPGDNSSGIEKVKEINLASFGLKEKDLENLVAKNIESIVRTDQLMVILQERSRQEEPDVLALDAKGVLFIFELKRWVSSSENLLQVLRYGQKFGRYDYEKLNRFYQSYSHDQGNRITLSEAHKLFFELDEKLQENEFNSDQQFIIITNGLDYDTWDAIAYWREKQLNISAQIYRLFKIGVELFIDFDPYGPVQDAPRDTENGIFIVNTNSTYMPDAYIEMVTEKKGAAYYGRKTTIQRIKFGNTVCLYHVGIGIIGIGKARTDYQKKDYLSDKDEEYFVPIDFEYLVDIKDSNWKSKAVHAWEINSNFSSSYRFRQTVFQLPSEFGDYIKTTLANKGNKKLN